MLQTASQNLSVVARNIQRDREDGEKLPILRERESYPQGTPQDLDVEYILCISYHGNNDEMWSTSCLIIQHKLYIVEQPSMCPFKSYYHYTKVCKLV